MGEVFDVDRLAGQFGSNHEASVLLLESVLTGGCLEVLVLKWLRKSGGRERETGGSQIISR